MSRLAYDPVEASRQHWIAEGWDDTASGVAAVVSVMRGWQLLLTQANELLRPFDLTFARYQVLGLLRPGSRLPLGQVGARLWITPGTVTSSVDRLEAAALIRRLPHPDDGRTVLAEITAKGRRVFDKAVDALNRDLFSAIPLSHEELDQLVGLMNKIRSGAGDAIGRS
jgi:DNA-binding MarR family transcriptional regulator